jgi:hypothetical protein
MVKKLKNTSVIICFILFIFLISKYYFSNENVKITNISRLNYTLNTMKYYNNLPLLKNDTKNIITYKNDLEDYKKKRKKREWESLLVDENK